MGKGSMLPQLPPAVILWYEGSQLRYEVNGGHSRAVRQKRLRFLIVPNWWARVCPTIGFPALWDGTFPNCINQFESGACCLEMPASYLIHTHYYEFSQTRFLGLQAYPHFPTLLLLFLGFLWFFHIRKKNPVPTIMPSSVVDTAARAVVETRLLSSWTSEGGRQ